MKKEAEIDDLYNKQVSDELHTQLKEEINTAEDSVLERLNQVLESGNIGVERGEGWETVTAAEGFCIIATMNHSGDYGKK